MNKSSKTLSAKAAVALGVVTIVVLVGWQVYDGCVANPPADMSKLEPAFVAAPAESKQQAAEAVAAVRAKGYAAAVEALAVTVDKGGYSEEQQQALFFTFTEIRRKVAGATRPDTNLLDRLDELTLRVAPGG